MLIAYVIHDQHLAGCFDLHHVAKSIRTPLSFYVCVLLNRSCFAIDWYGTIWSKSAMFEEYFCWNARKGIHKERFFIVCAEEHVCSQPHPTPSTKLLTYRCDLESSPIDYLNKGNHILCKTFSYVLCIHMLIRMQFPSKNLNKNKRWNMYFRSFLSS